MKEDFKDTKQFSDEQRYHRMIDEVQDYAILMLDKNGMVENWNKGAEKIKGYAEKEIVGKNFSIFYLPEDKASNLPQTLINLAATEGRAVHEGWRVRKDGTTFWGSVVITALHDEDNNIVGFTKVTRDLTERKLAEDQKERDAASIALQNRQLEDFAHITSHDLQEPIRKIQTFLKLAQRNLDDKESLTKYLDKIDTSAQKMVLLIKDVLNFSRLSHAKDKFTETDLNAVVKSVLSDFELLIEEKNVKVNCDELPIVACIPIQMHQLFGNLISNAIKFNTGNPVIDIAYEAVANEGTAHADEPSAFHKISVADNGVGFDTIYAEQAFQPFRRLTTEYTGTGIGLALCKRIVENHNGIIEVQSEPGKGTVFTIYLPKPAI